MTISIITAAYNRKDFLKDCIESVQASILLPFSDLEIEHLVFDDGSTDDTEKIWRKDPRIKFMRWENNQGAAAARNEAMKKAQGDYIFVLDSDDILLQRTLSYMYKALHEDTKEWVYSDFLRVDRDLRYLPKEDYFGWPFNNPQEIINAILKGEHFFQHNVLFTKKLFFEVGGYDNNLLNYHDLDLFIRFLRAGKMPLYLPIISHLHRMHEGNLSIGQGGEQHFKNLEVLKRKYSLS